MLATFEFRSSYHADHCPYSSQSRHRQLLLWLSLFLKKWAIPGLFFLYFRLFNKQLTVNKCSLKVAYDWIRTRVLWYRKRPLCQLRHNHCPRDCLFYFIAIFSCTVMHIGRFGGGCIDTKINEKINLSWFNSRPFFVFCVSEDQCDLKKSPNVYNSCPNMVSLEK